MALQHLRSSTANKRPDPAAMSAGQIAINSEATSPGLFFKDSSGNLVKVGPVHVGTTAPNASPAPGGTAGNSLGEQWLDTSGGTYVFKVWDGSAWRSEVGEFINASGDVMTGALGIIAGTAAAPGLYVSGDTNTGIYSPGADQLAISTNGTGRLFVDASGNVGVGIAAPANNSIHVFRASGYVECRAESGGNVAAIAADSSGSYVGNYSSIPLRFTTNNQERLRITSAGLVGVGTSSPGSILHCNYSTATDTYIRTSNSAASSGFDVGVSSGGIAYLFNRNNTDIRLGTNSQERVTITSAGLVGIGTSSPVFLLDLAGGSGDGVRYRNTVNSINTILGASTTAGQVGTTSAHPLEFLTGSSVKATLDTSGRLGIGTTSPSTSIIQTNQSTATIAAGINLYNSSGVSGGIVALAAAGSGGGSDALYLQGSSNIQIVTGAAERVRIDSSGRLLVGTSSADGSALLQTEAPNHVAYHQITANGNISNGGGILFRKSRGTTIGSNAIVSQNDTLGFLEFFGADGIDKASMGAAIYAQVDGTPGADDMPGRLVFSTTRDGQSSPIEAMRITEAGRILINTTLPSGANEQVCAKATENRPALVAQNTNASITVDAFIVRADRNTTNGTFNAISYYNDGAAAYRFRVADSGNCLNTNNSYAGLSDIKLKEKIVNANSQWQDIKSLQVRNYNFKEETGQPTHTQIGLIAQEVELISPGLVNESPDRDEEGNDLGTVTKSVNYSVLYMKAVKALQEAMERIEQLEADVAALKA